MFGYIVRRLISGVLVLIAVSMMVFAIFFYGPNDPALAYCPESRCTPAAARQHPPQPGSRPARPAAVRRVHERLWSRDRHIESGAHLDRLQLALPRASRSSTASPSSTISGNASRRPSRSPSAAPSCFLTIGLSSGIFAARRRGTAADKAIVERQPVHQRDPLLPAGPAGLPLPRPGLGHLPRDRLLLAVHRRTGQVRRPGMLLPWLDARHRLLHAVRPVQPRRDDRRRSTRTTSAPRGPRAWPNDASPTGTRCAPPSSRW